MVVVEDMDTSQMLPSVAFKTTYPSSYSKRNGEGEFEVFVGIGFSRPIAVGDTSYQAYKNACREKGVKFLERVKV